MFNIVFGPFISAVFKQASKVLPPPTREKLNEEVQEFFRAEDGLEFKGGDIYWYLLTLLEKSPPLSRYALAYCVFAATKIYLRELAYVSSPQGLDGLIPMAVIGSEFYVEHSDKLQRKDRVIQAQYLLRRVDISPLDNFSRAFYHSLLSFKSASREEVKSEMASILRDKIVFDYLDEVSKALVDTYYFSSFYLP